MGEITLDLIHNALAQRTPITAAPDGLMPAAVMLLLYRKDGEYCVLLNKRSMTVEHHKGEMSFPGGARDPEDVNFQATALRETHEEMGIAPDDITILGRLDDNVTRSNFLVKVFVGTIPYPYEFLPSSIEIAEVVEIPIGVLRDPATLRWDSRIEDGERVAARSYGYQQHLVYGATAKILDQFLDIIEDRLNKEDPGFD
ncbi:MAG: CoA pyrophosphatase [Chloroflexi bacterium]|nr:CoA pyrophosphatase [Chloroflexota bacterium]MYD49473.1 CoA pyrophosphatase [Chloroflexota bacterium]